MSGVLRPVTALLLATAVLMLGGGLQGVLLPLRAKAEGFTDPQIGWIGAAYYAGLLAGCLFTPNIIGRVGHIRAFAAFTAIVCTTPLLHAMWLTPPAWLALRLVNGVCFAGLLLIIESWLSSASDVGSRGRVLGTYSLVHLLVVTIGMQFINLAPTTGFELFSVVAILFALASLPIALTQTIAPAPPSRPRLRLGWLYVVSPVAFGAAVLTGLTNGAYWMLVPLFAQKVGFDTSDIAVFTATGVIGGAIVQWPVGHLSDRLGRRTVLGTLAAIAAVSGAALTLVPDTGGAVLFGLVALFGAANFPLYTLALAHANDLVHKKRAVEVSGGLLLVFSIGAVIGPLVGSLAMEAFGYNALFAATALAHAAIVALVLVRSRVRPSVPRRRRRKFVLVPRTTPVVYDLDPRGEPQAELNVPAPVEVHAASPADMANVSPHQDKA